ncbi:propanediol utilization protein [Paracoccus sp. MBLB3053]|uniref:Propanediol utilization protein n=1 Tax=Paracoccus aurantius TaxID=3073814 RepID=A0ABU2HT54_9RHOB|nr:propanediol utilization protein [Paracoccus sp. MBLB3053]MDS9468232.1 propanediol utilization protein [Paracoccus sp. MBLB3053]
MARVSGHFGEWIQGRLGPEGQLALVTLVCKDLAVEAELVGAGELAVLQEPHVLDPKQIASHFSALDLLPAKFRLRAGMPPGGGAGASTAALVALALAGERDGRSFDPAELAKACLAVEGATDPLMFPAPDRVLWAPREAVLLETLPPPPEAEILGGFWGAPQRTDPRDLEFPDVSDLVAQWRAGPDLAEAARLASQSAERCAALRGPAHDPTAELAARLGALGHVRAHTGSARGLIFATGTVPRCAAETLARSGMTGVIRFVTGGHD